MKREAQVGRHRVLVTGFMLVIITVFLGTLIGYPGEAIGAANNTIKVGWIGDLTGPASSLFIPYLEAIRNYSRHVNEQGGINGRKIKLIAEDDRYTIPGALAGYKKLVYRNKVTAILGMGGSGQHKALYSQIERDRVPVITVSWSGHVSRPFKRYSFQPTDDCIDEIKLMVDYLVNIIKVKDLRLAYVYADNEAGKAGLDQLKKSVSHYGIDIMSKEIVNFGDISAITQVLNLKKSKANYIIFVTVGSGLFSLLRDANKFGFSPTFISTFHAMGEDSVKIAGKGARNLMGVSAFGSWYDSVPGVSEMKKITVKYHPETEYSERMGTHRYYTKGWLTALIFAEGAKRAGETIDGEALIAGLERIKNLDTKGLSAPITYGPKKRKANDSGKFYKADLEKGYFVTITDWIKPMH